MEEFKSRPEWRPSKLKMDSNRSGDDSPNFMDSSPTPHKKQVEVLTNSVKSYMKKKLYYSRRAKNFDESADNVDDNAPESMLDTAAIVFKDT